MTARTITVRPSGGKPELTVVFLHGFGMTAADMAEEFVELFLRFPEVRFVFPEAPRLGITAHDGEETHAWFDYISDYGGAREDVAGLRSLRKERFRLLNLISSEKRHGAPVLIGGLSQGGCMALDLATRVEAVGVVTCVAHRLFLSRSMALRCPWFALTAEHDDCFPAYWAAPRPGETALHETVDACHHLLGGEGPAFVAAVIERHLHKEKG